MDPLLIRWEYIQFDWADLNREWVSYEVFRRIAASLSSWPL
jgi:hypothetical protein